VIFDEWIEQAYALGASDLHLEAGTPVIVRVRGELQSVGGIVTGEALLQVGQDLLGTEGWREFKGRGSADLSADIGGVRCRANLYRTIRGMAVAVRLLSPGIKDLRACNLHPDFRRFIEASSGLIIVSGPTGSGKSTTLAALIEEINATRARNIVVLESPIEYVFANRQSFVRQREIPTLGAGWNRRAIGCGRLRLPWAARAADPQGRCRPSRRRAPPSRHASSHRLRRHPLHPRRTRCFPPMR
jgi:twitching motility protein PilT